MKTTKTLEPADIEEAVRYWLLHVHNAEAAEGMRFEINRGCPGSIDPREPSDPSLRCVKVDVEDKPDA